jgi:hypothetical protein
MTWAVVLAAAATLLACWLGERFIGFRYITKVAWGTLQLVAPSTTASKMADGCYSVRRRSKALNTAPQIHQSLDYPWAALIGKYSKDFWKVCVPLFRRRPKLTERLRRSRKPQRFSRIWVHPCSPLSLRRATPST